MAGGAIIIGVGNADRGDDGAGPAVVRRLREAAPDGVDVVAEAGDVAALIERWSGRPLAVVVDAVRSAAPPGTVRRVVCDAGKWSGVVPDEALSSHTLGIATAVELSRVLDRLPDRLVVYGIEADGMDWGAPLSPPVAAAVETVAGLVVREIDEAR